MKKLISLMIVLFVALSTFAQEREVELTIPLNKHKVTYNGGTSDRLIPTTRDTIDYIIEYKSFEYVKKIAALIKFDTIAGADTIVKTSLFGKEFEDDGTWVQIIASANSSAVTAAINTVIASDYTETTAAHAITDNLGATATVAAQTLTPLDKTYNFYRLRLIIGGDDVTGTGIKVTYMEMKLFTD